MICLDDGSTQESLCEMNDDFSKAKGNGKKMLAGAPNKLSFLFFRLVWMMGEMRKKVYDYQ